MSEEGLARQLKAQIGEATLQALEDARAGVDEGTACRRALRFAETCVGWGRPLTDVEGLFLLEDLKAAGLPKSSLVAIRDAMRRDNADLGRALRDRAEKPGASGGSRVSHAGKASLVKWGTPAGELDGVAHYIQSLIKASVGELCESQVCVAVPNTRWGRLAQRALERRLFSVSRTQLGYDLAEDPRSLERAKVSSALIVLDLLACPRDPTAWRVWCGIGRPDLGAAAWAELLGRCDGVPQFGREGLLSDLVSPDSLLRARVEQGRSLIAEKSGLRGYSLLHAAGAEGVDGLAGLVEQADGCDDAEALACKAHGLLCGPAFSEGHHEVHVVTYEAATDAAYDLVVIVGAVEGLERPSGGEGGREVLRAVGLPCRELLISHFSTMPLDAARKAGVRVGRTRWVDGAEMAHVGPSHALSALSADLPPTQDGQAFLAR